LPFFLIQPPQRGRTEKAPKKELRKLFGIARELPEFKEERDEG